MKCLLYLLFLYLLPINPSATGGQHSIGDGGQHSIGDGEQPHISRDTKGIIRIVYGQKDKIFCAASSDNGASFSSAVLVAQVPGMHLGMSRGPQIASSDRYSIITAMDKSGNIHCFRLGNSSKSWQELGNVNDLKGSCPEGLMSIAADMNDNFYAVWLDIRTGKKNEVYFSSLPVNAHQWSANTLIYQSPDGHVCECCRPTVYAEGKEVAVMFRNWLNGSRDLYLLSSSNKGRNFANAQKLGEDSWQLNGCPMDGGGLAIDASGAIHTVWQRKGFVYYCRPGDKEINMGKGRECSLTLDGRTPILSMQDGDALELIKPAQRKTIPVGNGSFLQSLALPGDNILCAWENNKTIQYKKLSLQ
ncbi:MAG TPA: hypothetical protein VGM31_07075 [Puia sp.]|jgi:hypothetical protein